MASPLPDRDRPDRTPHRDLAGAIGWGLLFALAAALLVIRMIGGGGC